ncbi:nuclear polyadenylated RNA-binding protein 3 [Emydomyces testavorans]|uniref:Nuclear polyadenylated RNA-binding protein 3 n=1 Tax=Emydomyces testavorans TaxID=2070801 RepID=A0AAF0DKK2_9EURO|nr:nuclear polyadenylated RNA-binding protein 3 [Emydomyces testavorans]
MASEPPDDVLHFRGKTLTPESPRPLHIPEPSNIPVLENQMDPIFNDTSTYETASQTTDATLHLAKIGDTAQLMEQYARIYSLLGEGDNNLAHPSGQDKSTGSVPASDQAGAQGPKNEFNVSAVQNLLPVSQSSSSLTATSARETPTNVPSSSNHILNHALPSDSFQTEVGPFPNLAAATHLTHTEGCRKDQTLQNNGQAISREPDNGINYQNLLDNLCQPVSIAPSASDATATISTHATDSNNPSLNTEFSLPPTSNLPPRPPPQENPAIHPNYSPTDDIRSFHNLHSQKPNESTHFSQSNLHESATIPLGASSAPTLSSTQTESPSLLASFRESHPPNLQVDSEAGTVASGLRRSEATRNQSSKSPEDQDDEAPWGPEIQKKYDEFLHNERIYVTEGVWDRFAPGSRLFVGNLPSERVTKRDLFHLFHKYGKLAQISIKPAYGFVQFMDATSCRNALEAEEGGVIRGRKIHLEISKPQRSARNAPESSRPARLRRSKSPDRASHREIGRNARLASERYDRTPSDRRSSLNEGKDYGDHRHRDNYRPTRSPPRGSRRDEYRSRDRSTERYDHRSRQRSRSPYRPGDRYRSPTPRDQNYDSDSDLPIPKRAPRHVPDVQIIVLENIDNEFVYRVETAFRDRGLRTDVLILSPRIGLPAVIRRQILEGVLAIVRLSKSSQYSGKIPLQVFDRGSSAGNVRFNEYSGLEPKVAAEVVLQARNIPISAPNQSLPSHGLGVQPPAPPAPPQIPLVNQPNVASLISKLDAPTLQSLLGALQQNPTALTQQQYPQSSNQPATNITNLLAHVTRQNNAVPPTLPASQYAPIQHFGQPPTNPSLGGETNLAALLAKGQLPQTNSSQVQNIMEQLTKWKQ